MRDSYPTVWFAISGYFPQIALRHSGPALTLSNAAGASLPSPHLLVAGAGAWAASLLGVNRWAHNLWGLIIYLFFFPVMLPSEVPSLATDLPVRVFPGV